jgi:hypothetical protein
MNVPNLLIEDIFNALVTEGAIAETQTNKFTVERAIKNHFATTLIDAWKIDDIQQRSIESFNKTLSDSDAIKVMEYLAPRIIEGLGINLEVVDSAIARLALEGKITLVESRDSVLWG